LIWDARKIEKGGDFVFRFKITLLNSTQVFEQRSCFNNMLEIYIPYDEKSF